MNITVVQRRWRDVEVGDIVCDDRWRWQRWEQVTKIKHYQHTVEVWWGANQNGRGYNPSAISLVNVQVES